MALISCPECNKSISNLASSCPFCGYPLKSGLITKIYLIGEILPNWMPLTLKINDKQYQINYSDVFSFHTETITDKNLLSAGSNCVLLEHSSCTPTITIIIEYINPVAVSRNRTNFFKEEEKIVLEPLNLSAGSTYLLKAEMNKIPVEDEFSQGYYEDGINFSYMLI